MANPSMKPILPSSGANNVAIGCDTGYKKRTYTATTYTTPAITTPAVDTEIGGFWYRLRRFFFKDAK